MRLLELPEEVQHRHVHYALMKLSKTKTIIQQLETLYTEHDWFRRVFTMWKVSCQSKVTLVTSKPHLRAIHERQ